MGSKANIVEYLFGSILGQASNNTPTIAFEEKRLNKRTGSATHIVRLNNGVGMSRITTKTGSQWDTIYQHPKFASKEQLDAAIVDYYNNGLTQDRIAALLDCSQSYVSNVLRNHRKSRK